MKSIRLKPEIEELTRLNEFIQSEFSLCDPEIDLIIEEIFVNIAQYSKCSYIEGNFKVENDLFTIIFKDDGMEFNPLIVDSPDFPDSVDEAEIGGLGIHLVKNLADKMHYEYADGKNQLTITKKC